MKKLLPFAVLALFATNAMADLFAWVDDQGIRRHGETVPKQYAATARNLTAEARTEPAKLASEEKEKSPITVGGFSVYNFFGLMGRWKL